MVARALGVRVASLAALVLLAALAEGPARAAEPLRGGAPAAAYPQAVARSRMAAEAVLGRDGAESCLRGKLTNALLGLSASCDAEGLRNGLCALANRAVVSSDWSLQSMDATARALLEQQP